MASLKKRIEGEIESALAGLGGGPVKTAAVCEAILNGWGVDKESFGATASGKLLWTREYPKAFATLRKKGIIYAPQWGQVALGAGDAGEPTPSAAKAVKEAPVGVKEVEPPSEERMTPTLDLEGIDPELLARAAERARREAEEEAQREAEERPSPVDDGDNFTEEAALPDPPSPIEDGDNFTEEGALLDPPSPVEDGDNFTEEGATLDPPSPVEEGEDNFTEEGALPDPPSPVDEEDNFTEEGASLDPPAPVEEGDNFTEEGALLDPPSPIEDDGDNFTEEDEVRLAELTEPPSAEESPSASPEEEDISELEDASELADITDLFDDNEVEEEEPQAERVPLPERRVSFKGKDYLFYAMSEDGYITLSDDALEGAVTVKLSQGDIEDELEGVQAKLYQAVLKDEDNFLKALAHRSTAMGFDSPMGCFGSEEERDECAKCFMDIWCKSHETFRAS